MQPAKWAALCEAPRGILRAVVWMSKKFADSIPCHSEAQERESLESALGLRVITSLDLRHHLHNLLDLHCVLRHGADLLDSFSALLPPSQFSVEIPVHFCEASELYSVLQNYKDCDAAHLQD